MSNDIIKAPKVPSNLKMENLHSWRVDNDYPRIVKYLLEIHPRMKEWMSEFNIDENDLIQNNPAKFLGTEGIWAYSEYRDGVCKGVTEVYIARNPFENIKRLKICIEDDFGTKKLRYIKSFVEWIEIKTKKKFHIFSNHGHSESQSKFERLELIDLRYNEFKIFNFESTELCFCDLQYCKFESVQSLMIWFSNLNNAIFSGLIPFVDIHHCNFCFNDSYNYIYFNNGRYDQWIISESTLIVKMENCNLNHWTFLNTKLEGIFNNILIYRIDAFFRKDINGVVTCRNLKKIYSECFDSDSASKMRLKEKKEELKSKKGYKLWCSFLENILWGYGERPIRVLGWACAFVFLVFPILFYLSANSPTIGDFGLSVYYSMITFSTLGYGDFVPGEGHTFIQFACGFESLLGIFFMTLVISAFISKSSR